MLAIRIVMVVYLIRIVLPQFLRACNRRVIVPYAKLIEIVKERRARVCAAAVVVVPYGLYVQHNVPSLSLSLSPPRRAGCNSLSTPRAPDYTPSRKCLPTGKLIIVMVRSDISVVESKLVEVCYVHRVLF